MQLKKVVAFVVTTRPDEATAFYRDVLGFELVRDDGFALVFDAHGTMLRIAKAREFTPFHGTVLGWEVEDIGQAVAELVRRGATFERFPGFPQDEAGVCTFPTGDRVAWFKDPEGNVLSLSQHHDPRH